MGLSICKVQIKKKRITTSSWISSENENPFETCFNKKERLCIRESYQRIIDPKEIIGNFFVNIVNDLCPELKKIFGVDRAPKAIMLKMPKFGSHVLRMADFLEQLTAMLGTTENLVGAWQIVRKTGRSHSKIPFLEKYQNQLEKNYFLIIIENLIIYLLPYLNGLQKEEDPENEKKRARFTQTYSATFVNEVWRRFLIVVCNQITESFELEKQKCINSASQNTLAPHQKAENEEAKKRRQNTERQSELENYIEEKVIKEEMFEDPF